MNAGFYGKMPCRGDFVSRGLARSLVERLDGWLQQGMVQSRKQLGERWLDHYLVSPLWYGYFGPGVVDDGPWLGVMVPSVDRVGRYFPCMILLPTPPLPSLVAFQAQRAVLEQGADLLLESLADGFDFDRFCEQVSQLRAVAASDPPAAPLPEPAPLMVNLHPQREMWQGASLETMLGAPCVWCSEGSDTIAPQLLLSDGLPSAAAFAQLLTGQACPNRDGGEP